MFNRRRRREEDVTRDECSVVEGERRRRILKIDLGWNKDF